MQQVAAELNHTATAFVRVAADEPAADWALRWFSPASELELCGHGTLATTHVLREAGAIDLRARFATRAGVLTAEVDANGAVTLDFPLARPTETAVRLGTALGVEPVEVCGTGALRDLLAVFPGESAVRAIAPDLAALAELTARENVRGVIVTSEADGAEYDFVSRFFAPAVGIDEDPVTGSAHTALAAYWSGRLGRDELVGYQASTRGGVVRAAVDGDRVRLTGSAVTVLEGELYVEG